MFRIEPLSTVHNRSEFSCGIEPLDRYIKEQAKQDIRRRASACFVAVDSENGKIAGFYTLSAGAVPLPDIPEDQKKRLPRYPTVPVARLGRLAVASSYQGQKLGAALLWDAASRAARSEVMAYALLVDAKDDTAVSFYLHHGFISLGSRRLMLPLTKRDFG
jgi:GNAT superfamily N-acetyltransferase